VLEKPHFFKSTFQNETWYDSLWFPDSVRLKFTNVTHVNGSYPVVSYGFTDPEWPQGESRGRATNFNTQGFNSSDAIFVIPDPQYPLVQPFYGSSIPFTRSHFPYIPGPKFHYKYSNEYTDGTFQGTTASYAFIHFSCKTANAKSIQLPDINIGPNVEYNAKNVVCLKEVFDNIKATPNQNKLSITIPTIIPMR